MTEEYSARWIVTVVTIFMVVAGCVALVRRAVRHTQYYILYGAAQKPVTVIRRVGVSVCSPEATTSAIAIGRELDGQMHRPSKLGRLLVHLILSLSKRTPKSMPHPPSLSFFLFSLASLFTR